MLPWSGSGSQRLPTKAPSPGLAATPELVGSRKVRKINTVKLDQRGTFIGPDMNRGRNRGRMLEHDYHSKHFH